MGWWLAALGGAAGSTLRYGVGVWAARLQAEGRLAPGWPIGTFTVNLIGGLAMGLLVAWLAHRGAAGAERWRILLGVGVLGGFTTFSAFSLELMLMLDRRAYGLASAYALASVVLATGAVGVGLLLGRRLFA